MSSLVVIGPQIKEKQRGAQCAPSPPAYMVPKDPSPNRVKVSLSYFFFILEFVLFCYVRGKLFA